MCGLHDLWPLLFGQGEIVCDCKRDSAPKPRGHTWWTPQLRGSLLQKKSAEHRRLNTHHSRCLASIRRSSSAVCNNLDPVRGVSMQSLKKYISNEVQLRMRRFHHIACTWFRRSVLSQARLRMKDFTISNLWLFPGSKPILSWKMKSGICSE